eukprot:6476899-Amphidinium_carterae.2
MALTSTSTFIYIYIFIHVYAQLYNQPANGVRVAQQRALRSELSSGDEFMNTLFTLSCQLTTSTTTTSGGYLNRAIKLHLLSAPATFLSVVLGSVL